MEVSSSFILTVAIGANAAKPLSFAGSSLFSHVQRTGIFPQKVQTVKGFCG